MAEPAAALTAKIHGRDYQHCFDDLPYRSLVFIRFDGMGKPLYRVAGSEVREAGAVKSLKHAFSIFGGDCYYCHNKVIECTIDHIEPLGRDGTDTLQNLAISCKPCNQSKGLKLIEIFNPDAGRAWLEAMLLQIEERLKRLPS